MTDSIKICSKCSASLPATAEYFPWVRRQWLSNSCRPCDRHRRKNGAIRPLKQYNVSAFTELDWAYLAGIIDGDGCIRVSILSRGTAGITIEVAMTDKPLIEWLYTSLGGAYRENDAAKYERKGWKPYYRWMASTRLARLILPRVLPYLRVKKRQAELTLKFGELLIGTVGRPVGMDNIAERHIIKEKMRLLNFRGRNAA